MTDTSASSHATPQPARTSASPPMVTICCITFNHASFIAQALEGFLAQRTLFPFEILVHDDHSTDGTDEIIRRFQAAHPGRIRAVLQDQNQYALGRRIMPMFADWVDSEFIAVCEGDDYWTDPGKLQLQIDYLRAHANAAGCFHDTIVVDDLGNIIEQSYFGSDQDVFTQRDVLATLLSREPTCSLVFRASVMTRPLPSWYLRRPTDLYLDLLITEHGELHFVRRNMGAYRRHSTGRWTSTRASSQVAELLLRLQLLHEDPVFNSRYATLLASRINEFQALLYTRADFDAETVRLTAIVDEQAAALAASAGAAAAAQKHIDALTAQLDQLAATSKRQDVHIKTLERERDRLDDESTSARTEGRKAAAAAQEHIDSLLAQLDQLAGTLKQQDAHIKALEKERDRLLEREAQLVEQLDRARIDGELQIRGLCNQLAQQSKDSQVHIDGLLAQLGHAEASRISVFADLNSQIRQLAETIRSQGAYIESLTKECGRLRDLAEVTRLREAGYLRVIDEQTVYLLQLEAARQQSHQ